MTTQVFYRRANVPSGQAIQSINERFPGARLTDFQKKTATVEDAANIRGGKVGEDIYVATVRFAEFPPSGDGESAPPSDSAPEAAEGPPSDEPSEEAPEDEAPSEDGPPSEDEAPEEDKLSPEEETVSLLHQILDALTGGAGPGDDLGPPDLGDGGLPDVGSPPPGMGASPGGPGGPGPGGPGIPPPVKPKAPLGPAFSNNGTITATRADVDESVTTTEIISEAHELFPGMKVAKVNRKDPSLVASKIALVTLVRK